MANNATFKHDNARAHVEAISSTLRHLRNANIDVFLFLFNLQNYCLSNLSAI